MAKKKTYAVTALTTTINFCRVVATAVAALTTTINFCRVVVTSGNRADYDDKPGRPRGVVVAVKPHVANRLAC